MSITEKKNILVVDDDPGIRTLLQTFLGEQGYRVSTAENGLRLLSLIKTTKIDLLILDIMLQWMSGLDLCRSLRKNKALTDLRIIFISGKSGESDRESGFQAGCDDYFVKPFSLTDLGSRVEKLIGSSRE